MDDEEAKGYYEDTIYKMLFRDSQNTENYKHYYLASRCVNISSYCDFCIFTVKNGGLDPSWLRCTDGTTETWELCAVPVVSLKSKILTSGQDENGAWNLIVE